MKKKTLPLQNVIETPFFKCAIGELKCIDRKDVFYDFPNEQTANEHVMSCSDNSCSRFWVNKNTLLITCMTNPCENQNHLLARRCKDYWQVDKCITYATMTQKFPGCGQLSTRNPQKPIGEPFVRKFVPIVERHCVHLHLSQDWPSSIYLKWLAEKRISKDDPFYVEQYVDTRTSKFLHEDTCLYLDKYNTFYNPKQERACVEYYQNQWYLCSRGSFNSSYQAQGFDILLQSVDLFIEHIEEYTLFHHTMIRLLQRCVEIDLIPIVLGYIRNFSIDKRHFAADSKLQLRCHQNFRFSDSLDKDHWQVVWNDKELGFKVAVPDTAEVDQVVLSGDAENDQWMTCDFFIEHDDD